MNTKQIVAENNVLIQKVINYICNIKKIEKSQILEAPRNNVKDILYHLRKEKYDIQELRRERDKMQEDLYYIERNAGLSAKQTDSIGGGHDNGQKPNGVYNRLLEIEIMKEEIFQKTVEIRLIEKTKTDISQMMRDFIYLVPQVQYARILEATFFDLVSDDHIACELNYEYDCIRMFRKKAIHTLGTIIKEAIEG